MIEVTSQQQGEYTNCLWLLAIHWVEWDYDDRFLVNPIRELWTLGSAGKGVTTKKFQATSW